LKNTSSLHFLLNIILEESDIASRRQALPMSVLSIQGVVYGDFLSDQLATQMIILFFI